MPRPLVIAIVLAAGLLSGSGALAAQQQGSTALLPALEFHSGFWVNLHHFLYLQARSQGSDVIPAPTNHPQDQYAAPASLTGLSPSEQQALNASVTAYEVEWSPRDLRNNDMALINDRLAELEDCSELLPNQGTAHCISGLRPEMTAALNRAAPIYRAHWWPEQDRRNRAWIAGIAPLVRQMGEVVGEQLITAYHRRWPPLPLRVDVVGYAGAEGAYDTLTSALHVVISSTDPRNQDAGAFEVLFREASEPLAEAVNQAIALECRKQEKPIPREFLDALVSYTTGYFVQRAFASEFAGTPAASYTPYAVRYGLFNGVWSDYREILASYWQPYLDGKLTLDVAVSRIVSTW